MSLDAIHYALAGVIVTLAGTIVALAKHSWGAVQKANEERLKDQKACAKKNEQTLEKIPFSIFTIRAAWLLYLLMGRFLLMLMTLS